MSRSRVVGAASRGVRVTVLAPARASAAARGLSSWLTRAAPARARGNVTIALVTDVAMRRLNARFRGVDAATDVLSFPAGAATKAFGPNELGEIAIALGVAARQARAYGHGLGVELRVLALHGLLHLLGYDHDRDNGHMERLETRLRRQAGLTAGLIARVSKRSRA